MRRLSGSELSQLRFLRDNPGSWGGHLDRGQPCDDPELCDWIRAGWVESRPHVVRRKHYTTKFGYFLTEAGRAVLASQETSDGR